MKTRETLMEDTKHIHSRIQQEEMFFLYDLAKEVPIGGEIVEIGSCYGSSSACLCLGSNDKANVSLIDIFVHHPVRKASYELLDSNLKQIGLKNFKILKVDCMTLDGWDKAIDLIHIDGAHDYRHIKHDLVALGTCANLIVCHDYDHISSVTKAINDFILEYGYKIKKIVKTMVLLEKE